MHPTLLALKAAVVLAATDASNNAKIADANQCQTDWQFHYGRADAFQEVLRLITTVSALTDEGKPK